MTKYPNLELIAYKCKEYAYKLHPETLKDSIFPTFSIDTFMQTWGNTATGFDAEKAIENKRLDETPDEEPATTNT